MERSFQEMLEDAQALCKRLAPKYSNRPNDWDDLIQEGLLGLYQAWSKDNGLHAPRGSNPWLYSYGVRTIRNSMCNWMDRESPETQDHYPLETEKVDIPVVESDRIESEQWAWAEVRKLDGGMGTTLVDLFYHGKSQKEVAQEQGISPVLLNMRLKKTFQKIRKNIALDVIHPK